MEEITLKSKFIIFLLEHGEYPDAQEMFMTGFAEDNPETENCGWEEVMSIVKVIAKYQIDSSDLFSITRSLFSGNLTETIKTVKEIISKFNTRKFNLKTQP